MTTSTIALRTAAARLPLPRLDQAQLLTDILKDPPEKIGSKVVTSLKGKISPEAIKPLSIFLKALQDYLGPGTNIDASRILLQIESSRIPGDLWEELTQLPKAHKADSQVAQFYKTGEEHFSSDTILEIRKVALLWNCNALLEATFTYLRLFTKPNDLQTLFLYWTFAYENRDRAFMSLLFTFSPEDLGEFTFEKKNDQQKLEEFKALYALRICHLYRDSKQFDRPMVISRAESIFLLDFAFKQEFQIRSLQCEIDSLPLAQSLGKILRKHCQSPSFELDRFSLTTKDEKVLVSLIPTLLSTKISHLTIDAKTDCGFECFLNLFENIPPQLKSLTIRCKNPINLLSKVYFKTKDGTEEAFRPLCDIIARNKGITHLSLNLDEAALKEGATDLMQAFRSSSLEEVELSLDRYDPALNTLLPGLAQNSSLRQLTIHIQNPASSFKTGGSPKC